MAGHAILQLEKTRAGRAPSTSRTGPCPPSLARRTERAHRYRQNLHESRAVRHCRCAVVQTNPSNSIKRSKTTPARESSATRLESISFKIAKSVQGRLKNSKCDSPGCGCVMSFRHQTTSSKLEPMLGKIGALPEELAKPKRCWRTRLFQHGECRGLRAGGDRTADPMGRQPHHPPLQERSRRHRPRQKIRRRSRRWRIR